MSNSSSGINTYYKITAQMEALKKQATETNDSNVNTDALLLGIEQSFYQMLADFLNPPSDEDNKKSSDSYSFLMPNNMLGETNNPLLSGSSSTASMDILNPYSITNLSQFSALNNLASSNAFLAIDNSLLENSTI